MVNATYRAWQALRYGRAHEGALALRSLPVEEPPAGHVRIRVGAASLNPIDFKLLRGDLKRVQKLVFPRTLGFDAAGTVDAIGAHVVRFKVGDRVFVRASRDNLGAFAEVSVQPEAHVALEPKGLGAQEAASLPLVALTTVQALVDRAKVASGQRVLIHAGSGGLGSFAVQYARAKGLVVDATTSAKNADFVSGLGAHTVVAYDREDYRAKGPVYDVVFDTLGGEHTLDAFRVVKPGGVVVSVAGPPDEEMARRVAPNFVVRAVMGLMARKVYSAASRAGARYYRFLTESDGAALAEVAELAEGGKIKPVVDRVFPFEEAPEAFAYLERGRARGKVILAMPRP